jgi:YD repeat-containing protein
MIGTMIVRISFLLTLLLTAFSANCQYYYKDIFLSHQNQENWKLLRDQKVREVNIQSIDANNEPTPGFECSQNISTDFSSITTFTKSTDIPPSTLVTYYDQTGRITKTVDTSDTYQSTTMYTYNENGAISSLTNTSIETDNNSGASEKHVWIYEGTGPKKMIKIRNGTDTTIVNFVKDEKGNIAEEQSVRNGEPMPPVYYYYDNDGRLTDIVRYNQKAARLLPDYVFTYNSDRISSMLFVRTGSTDYQTWMYEYNPSGLKTSETCYDKRKQVVVKINYNYIWR